MKTIPPEILDNVLEIISYGLNVLLAWIAMKLKRKNKILNNENILQNQTPQSRATRDAIRKIRESQKP